MSEERRTDLRPPRWIKMVLAVLLIAGGTMVWGSGINWVLANLVFRPGISGTRHNLFVLLIGLLIVFVGLFISLAGSFLGRWRVKNTLGICLIVVGGWRLLMNGRAISQDPFAPGLNEVALGHTLTILPGNESFDVWVGSWGIASGVVLLGVGLGLLTTLAMRRKDPSQVQIGSTYPYSFAKRVGVIVTILLWTLVWAVYIYNRTDRPELRLDLLIADTRVEVLLHNGGADLARGVRVGVVTWPHRARAAADVSATHVVPDIPAGSDTPLRIEIWPANRDASYLLHRRNRSTSGYIVAACQNCKTRKAWAFYIPGANDQEEQSRFYPLKENRWPIVAFSYPDDTPCLHDCVNYPRGICSNEELRGSLWESDTAFSAKELYLCISSFVSIT